MRHGPDPTQDAADALRVQRIEDPRSGLRALIALDAEELGPAVGGCRMRPYPDIRAAALEAGGLARAMTRKVLLAGLPFGGGKTVVLGDPRHDKTAARWAALGRAIERLDGRYWTGEDSGTTPADMDAIGRVCRFVLGRSGGAGDLGPMTAAGALHGIEAAVRHRLGGAGLAGLTVAVQGLGAVGMPLAELLAATGARLVVADLDPDRVDRAVERLGARAVPPAAILEAEVDLLVPCALGPVLDGPQAARLRCALIAGPANNQLDRPDTAERLHRRGILFVPDYVVSAGGVIAATTELEPGGFAAERVRDRLAAIGERVRAILAEAAAADLPPLAVAEAQAARLRRARLAAATGRRGERPVLPADALAC
jgi:leucine dehydrogenase